MATRVFPAVRNVFDYFQNLNLLVLLEDLRQGRVARETWLSGSLLCPVAHGLGTEQQVAELYSVDQETGMLPACGFAAQQLGAKPEEIMSFVQRWDEGRISEQSLLRQLQSLWEERLEDAELMQELLTGVEERRVSQSLTADFECAPAP